MAFLFFRKIRHLFWFWILGVEWVHQEIPIHTSISTESKVHQPPAALCIHQHKQVRKISASRLMVAWIRNKILRIILKLNTYNKILNTDLMYHNVKWGKTSKNYEILRWDKRIFKWLWQKFTCSHTELVIFYNVKYVSLHHEIRFDNCRLISWFF